MKITLFSLAWDTAEGTDCRLFGSESDWFGYFSDIIIADIVGIETAGAAEIRTAIKVRNISLAYELWQASYKCELDSYNWSKETIAIGEDGAVLEIVSGELPEP